MGAPDRPLELRPETFERVDVVVAIHPFVGRMIDGAVLVAQADQLGVRLQFIAADGRSDLNVLDDMGFEGGAADVLDDASNDITRPLQHAEHNGLAGSAATALAAFPLSADICLVNFNVIVQGRVAVDLRHVLANFVAHTPSRFVGDAELTLQLFGRHAVPGRGEQVHGVKPLLQGRMRPCEGRSGHRVDVVAAPRAGIGRQFGETRKLPMLAALGAVQAPAETDLHQMVETSAIVRETLVEVLDRELRGHGQPPIRGV